MSPRKHQRPSGYRGNKGGNTERVYRCRCGFDTTNWSEWLQHKRTCEVLNS